jgi:hypothetical protein
LAGIWLNKSDSSRAGKIPASLAGIWLAGIRRRRPDVTEFPFFTVGDFMYEPNAKKYFWKKLFFLKNDFVENILRRKTFYIETNGVLMENSN